MESVDLTRICLSLALVIGLMWLVAWGMKKTGLDKRLRGVTSSSGRLQVVEAIYLDPKRKLVLVRADTNEYLLLLSGDVSTVIEKLPARDAV